MLWSTVPQKLLQGVVGEVYKEGCSHLDETGQMQSQDLQL